MGRFIEIAPGKFKLDSSAEPTTEEVARGAERIREMVAARKAPLHDIWDPKRTVSVLGHEVATKGAWERIKKERNIGEYSPNDSVFQSTKSRPKFDARAAWNQAVEGALKKAQAGELPPVPPPQPRPTAPPPPRIVTPEEARHEEVEQPIETNPIYNPPPGVRAETPEDAVAAMMKRHGWR